MAACEPGDVVNAADWAWGSVGWPAMILFWPRATWLRDLSVFLLANVVVTLGGLALAGALDPLSLSKFLVVSVGAITLQAGASAGGHALDLAARWAVENSNCTARAEADRKAADQVHADRLARYAEVRSAVAPVLNLLAQGADPADPDVRHGERGRRGRLRRLIAETDDAPDPLLHTLRACAFDVERRGVVVLFLTAGTVAAAAPRRAPGADGGADRGHGAGPPPGQGHPRRHPARGHRQRAHRRAVAARRPRRRPRRQRRHPRRNRERRNATVDREPLDRPVTLAVVEDTPVVLEGIRS